MAAGFIHDGMKWRSDSDGYIATEYDDTYLVFVKASGETHFLNFLSFGIVKETSEFSKSPQELRVALCERFELGEDELSIDLVMTTISELDDTGLILPENMP